MGSARSTAGKMPICRGPIYWTRQRCIFRTDLERAEILSENSVPGSAEHPLRSEMRPSMGRRWIGHESAGGSTFPEYDPMTSGAGRFVFAGAISQYVVLEHFRRSDIEPDLGKRQPPRDCRVRISRHASLWRLFTTLSRMCPDDPDC